MTRPLTDDHLVSIFRKEYGAGLDPMLLKRAIRIVRVAIESDAPPTTGKVRSLAAEQRIQRGAEIASSLAHHRNTTLADIIGNGRYATITEVRHEAAWLMRTTIQTEAGEAMPYEEIGEVLGKRAAPSVLMGVRKIAARVAERPAYAVELRGLADEGVDELAPRRKTA